MITRVFQFLFRRMFNSVIFGITLMVCIALYVAIGSGRPDVRAFFEMSDLEFFSAWPLKVLMILLVANLMTVTWVRIPFTPPRYGVWCVHLGIITLIFGMAAYYNMKVEGLAIVPVKQTVDHFYDAAERSLHLRVSNVPLAEAPLPSLPRFNTYVPSKNPRGLRGSDLHGIIPRVEWEDPKTKEFKALTLAKELELSGELRLDVVGYYPYANVETKYVSDPTANNPALRLRMSEAHGGEPAGEEWLVAGDAQGATSTLGDVEIEHRHVREASTLDELKTAAARIHRIEVKVADFADTMFVEPGKSYPLGESGYSLAIEDFNPAWPMFGTGEIVRALTLKVTHRTPDGKQTEFRRMVLDGKPLQTDFALNVEGAPPMGKRQKEPIDKDLVVRYTLSDEQHLLPRQGASKRTLVSADPDRLIDIATAFRAPSQVRDLPGGKGEIAFGAADHMKITIERDDHVRKEEWVEEVAPAQRQRAAAETGDFQVAVVRVSVGDTWSQDVPVPFSQWADEISWGSAGTISLPGTRATLQMQLGNTRLPMPAKVTLEKFDAVPYPGGTVDGGMIRDFKSTLTIEERNGNRRTAVAHLNNPVYFGGFGDSYWTLFQAQWDPQGQRWTVIGVGNRPGAWVMIAGCVMIFVGVLYAFYAKPIIIRRMKQKALANATEAAQNRKTKTAELVTI